LKNNLINTKLTLTIKVQQNIQDKKVILFYFVINWTFSDKYVTCLGLQTKFIRYRIEKSLLRYLITQEPTVDTVYLMLVIRV
jgi:hypothetical protein